MHDRTRHHLSVERLSSRTIHHHHATPTKNTLTNVKKAAITRNFSGYFLVLLSVVCWISTHQIISRFELSSSRSTAEVAAAAMPCMLRTTQNKQRHESPSVVLVADKPQEELQQKLKGVTNSSSHFSACLLTMDDHSILDEWLAYHYFALKLRYLVVVVDPTSDIYPTALFQRWRTAAPDLTIVEWTDEDFALNATALKWQPGDDETPKNAAAGRHDPPRVTKHHTRQGQFYIGCAKHLHKYNHTWTAVLDVDEFLSINHEMLDNIQSVRQEPGHVLAYLQHLVEKQDSYVKRQGSCITVPRSLHGGKERRTFDSIAMMSHIPAGFDPRNLNTLSYIHRSTKKWTMADYSKSLLDVSALDPAKHFNGDGRHSHAAHQPIKNVCQHSASSNYDQAPLRVHHYLGTLESFLWKSDLRRKKDQWINRSGMQTYGIDDEMGFWLPGFVQLVGNERAHILLQDAGKLPKRPSSSSNTVNETIATASTGSVSEGRRLKFITTA